MNKLFLLFTIGFFSFSTIAAQDCPPFVSWDFTDSDEIVEIEIPDNYADCQEFGTTFPVVILMIGDDMFNLTFTNCASSATETSAIYEFLNGSFTSMPEEVSKIIFPDFTCTYNAEYGENEGGLILAEFNYPVPTLSQWGIILLSIVLTIFGIVTLKQRKKVFG